MNEYVIEIEQYADQARDAWNLNADDNNQWESLSTSEQHEIVGNQLGKGE